jgi:hypothetical protein
VPVRGNDGKYGTATYAPRTGTYGVFQQVTGLRVVYYAALG